MKPRKQRLHSAELRRLDHIAGSLDRIAYALEHSQRITVNGSNDIVGDTIQDSPVMIDSVNKGVGYNKGFAVMGNNDKSTNIDGNENNAQVGTNQYIGRDGSNYNNSDVIGAVSGDIVTTNGVGSPGKVKGDVDFGIKADQAIGKVEGDATHDKTECDNHAAGGFAAGYIENVRQERHTNSHNTNTHDAIKNLTEALQTKHSPISSNNQKE